MRFLFLIITLFITTFSCKQNEIKIKDSDINNSSIDSSSTIIKDNIRIKKYYGDFLNRALNKKQHNYKPKEGIIPDSITAIKIGEIILSNIYGKDKIIKERPFTALLINEYWIVYGFLPEGYKGGVAEIIIKKDNGEIINISHGK